MARRTRRTAAGSVDACGRHSEAFWSPRRSLRSRRACDLEGWRPATRLGRDVPVSLPVAVGVQSADAREQDYNGPSHASYRLCATTEHKQPNEDHARSGQGDHRPNVSPQPFHGVSLIRVRRSYACAGFGPPKTARSRRTVALDPETVAVLRAHRETQLLERDFAGDAYQDGDLVSATRSAARSTRGD